MLVIVAASIAAFYASARGLQDGEAVPVITVTATAATVTGIAGGILVFGDPLPGNPSASSSSSSRSCSCVWPLADARATACGRRSGLT